MASARIMVNDFRTSFFPYCGSAIKEYFEELKKDELTLEVRKRLGS